jgi:ribosome-associated protein
MKSDILKDLTYAAQAIYDKKGSNCLVLDVREICTMTDFFIIAEGSVDRHTRAISHSIIDELAKHGRKPVHVEGEREGDWVVLDFVDFIIHLFTPEFRERYSLERLWHKGKIVDVQIKLADKIIPRN